MPVSVKCPKCGKDFQQAEYLVNVSLLCDACVDAYEQDCVRAFEDLMAIKNSDPVFAPFTISLKDVSEDIEETGHNTGHDYDYSVGVDMAEPLQDSQTVHIPEGFYGESPAAQAWQDSQVAQLFPVHSHVSSDHEHQSDQSNHGVPDVHELYLSGYALMKYVEFINKCRAEGKKDCFAETVSRCPIILFCDANNFSQSCDSLYSLPLCEKNCDKGERVDNDNSRKRFRVRITGNEGNAVGHLGEEFIISQSDIVFCKHARVIKSGAYAGCRKCPGKIKTPWSPDVPRCLGIVLGKDKAEYCAEFIEITPRHRLIRIQRP